jgi:DNA (cytosine-5)-methyltransferase 1
MTPRCDFSVDQLEMRLAPDEIIVDSFAGGGGASLGIQWALGHGPHIAISAKERENDTHLDRH